MQRVRLHAILLALWCATAVSLRAADVQTLDGRTLSGDLKVDKEGRLTLTPYGTTTAAPLDLANILRADFKAPRPQAAAPQVTPQPQPQPQPPRWISRDIGRVARPGAAVLQGENLIVQGAGADIGGAADAFQFTYRPLTGNGEIVTRLVRLEPADRPIKVGLMLRTNIDPASAHASLLFVPRTGMMLQSRTKPGGTSGTRGPGIGAASPPLFLKLKRDGNRFRAYSSDDGKQWQLVGEDQIELPQTLLAGVAICSRSSIAPATANLDQLALAGPAVEEDAASKDPHHRNARGVLLRNSSFLAGHHVRITDEDTVRLQRDREYTLTPGQVAAVFINERTLQNADRVASLNTPGALITSGDFFEGTIREADHGRVRVSSVLFGLRQFELGRVLACVYNAAAPPATQFEIRLADGSCLYTDAIRPTKDGFILELPPVGEINVKLHEVTQISAGPDRFQSLTDLRIADIQRPEYLTAPPYVVGSRSSDDLPSSSPKTTEPTLTLASGVSVKYALNGAYRSLSARLEVPGNLLPTIPNTFVILTDGAEVLRTSGLTSLDDPVAATIDLTGVQTLTITLESPSPSLASLGIVARPVLVR